MKRTPSRTDLNYDFDFDFVFDFVFDHCLWLALSPLTSNSAFELIFGVFPLECIKKAHNNPGYP